MSNSFWSKLGTGVACAILGGVTVLTLEGYVLRQLGVDPGYTLKLIRTMRLVEKTYNGEIDRAKLHEGALKGMVEGVGDPYTTYLNAKDFKRLHEMTDGSFGGIGVIFGMRDKDFVIISALDNNPGAEAGLKSGDIIIGVDEKSTKGMTMDQVAHMIRGKIGTEVLLEVKDKEGKFKKVRIIRKEIKTTSIAGKMLPDTKIGYIRIAVFNENTSEDFAKKYKELEAQGMEATLLDLRRNPGGTLSDGVGVAQLLVKKGPIVSVVDKTGEKDVYESTLEKVKYPLAVLVDGGTASAAEIVSGAVKDTGSGKLFGEKTFGKGSVQSVFRLDGETAVKVTTAKYYTPSGVSIHNVGIEPDVKVELPEDATEDLQLKAAREYLEDELKK